MVSGKGVPEQLAITATNPRRPGQLTWYRTRLWGGRGLRGRSCPSSWRGAETGGPDGRGRGSGGYRAKSSPRVFLDVELPCSGVSGESLGRDGVSLAQLGSLVSPQTGAGAAHGQREDRSPRERQRLGSWRQKRPTVASGSREFYWSWALENSGLSSPWRGVLPSLSWCLWPPGLCA